jgi:hypothetical protein
MKITMHCGAPRSPMIISRHMPTYAEINGAEKRLDMPALYVSKMFGISWFRKGEFVFFGVQTYKKWGNSA